MNRRLGNFPDLIKKQVPLLKPAYRPASADYNSEKEKKALPSPAKDVQAISPKTKIYILDTTVFLHDPNALIHLKDNYIVIPVTVYDELDEFKKDMGELGTNSRHVSNFLKEMLINSDFKNGVPLKTGGKLFIDTEGDVRSFDPLKNHRDNTSNRILAVALKKQKEYPSNSVIIISNNPSILVKASAYGIKAEGYKNDQVEIYEGFKEIRDRKGLSDAIERNGRVTCPPDIKMVPNEFAIIKQGTKTIKTIYQNGSLTQLPLAKHDNVFGIKPLDLEQELAIHLLLDPDIDLVTITGEAGTGKTLLSLASAFEQVVNKKIYSRIAVARPIVPMGRDLGFLPGTVDEKVRPYMRPIFDSLDRIFLDHKPAESSENSMESKEGPTHKKNSNKKIKKGLKKSSNDNGIRKHGPCWQKYIDNGILQIEALSLIRGATLPRLFFIIDEAQNLTGDELKTIITRAGNGTKIVLTGDIKQIDCPYLTEKNNGISTTTHRLKESCLVGHMSLRNVHRSRLANLGVTCL